MSQNARGNNTRGGEGPFGHAQTKLFKFILAHPGCAFSEIHEGCFNDKNHDYTQNLIYENKDLLSVQEFDNSDMPKQYRINVEKFSEIVDVSHYLKNGEFVSYVPAPSA